MRRDRLIPASLVLALAAGAASFNGETDGNVDLFHEGDRLAHLPALREGKRLFREVFIQHGVGEDVLKPWLAAACFGDSLESLRRIGVNTYVYRGVLPACGWAALAVAAAALTRRAALAAVVVALSLLTFCECTDRHLLGLLAVAAAAAFFRGRRERWLVISGALGGAAALYSLEIGIFALSAIGVGLLVEAATEHDLRRKRSDPGGRSAAARALRRLACLIVPALIVWLPLVMICVQQGTLPDLVSNIRIQLFTRGDVFPVEYPRPHWIGSAPLWVNALNLARVIVLFYVMPATYLAAAWLIWLDRAERPRRNAATLALVTAFGACFWFGVRGRPDHWHIAYAVPAWLLFLATWAADRTASPTRLGRGLRGGGTVGAVAVMASLVIIGQGGLLGRRLMGADSWWLPEDLKRPRGDVVQTGLTRMGGVRVAAWQADYLRHMVRAIQELTPEGQPLLDLTNQPLLYYLADRRSPTRFHCESYVGASVALQADMLAEIRKRPPACVLWLGSGRPRVDLLGDFVQREYSPHLRIGPYVVMRPRSDQRTGPGQ